MTDVLIERELLERLEHVTRSLVPHLQCHTDLVAALAAPRQPEGDGLDVVAWLSVVKSGNKTATRAGLSVTSLEGMRRGYKNESATIESDEPLVRLSDAQRVIAGLREEISNLHTTMMAAAVEIQEHWKAHCDEEGYGPANLMHRLERGIASQYGYTAQTLVQIEAERDTLRQQLAERDGALDHIAKVCRNSRTSTRRLRWIEQRAQWAIDGKPYDNKAFDLPKNATASSEKFKAQRDKLAGLLRELYDGVNELEWGADLDHRIDAALAEVGK